MPIEPLPIILEDEQAAKNQAECDRSQTSHLLVSYGYLKLIGQFHYRDTPLPHHGQSLVLRTDRGVEIGTMLAEAGQSPCTPWQVEYEQVRNFARESGGKRYPLSTEGKVLRIATPEDLAEQAALDARKPSMKLDAEQLSYELDMDIKVLEIEPLLDRDRVIVYFASEQPVDFRDLVKRLASTFHARIEMRRVGARDEARLIADYETCGQQCCCKQFLKTLRPVPMRAAKIQKATLDPEKVSGRCMRLKCCLRYEQDTYEYLRKQLPRYGEKVMTSQGLGEVVGSQIITQLVMVRIDQSGQRVSFPVDELLPPDAPQPDPPAADIIADLTTTTTTTTTTPTTDSTDSSDDQNQNDDNNSRKRARQSGRRRSRSKSNRANNQQPNASNSNQDGDGKEQTGKSKSKRSRRNRKRRSRGRNKGNQSDGNTNGNV